MELEACLQDASLAAAASIKQAFVKRDPFRHAIIENFFQKDYLDELIAEFPAFNSGDNLNENGKAGGKSTYPNIRELGPAYRKLDDMIQSKEFLDWFSMAIGIPGLQYDPDYFGGGTHENRNGQELDPHVDFNRHPKSGLFRRVNLIIYLNEEWKESWGGTIDLHQNPYLPANEDQVVRILPLMNRAVVFETTHWSWHGFTPINIPMDAAFDSRKSIALYFYTKDRPEDEKTLPHSTIYVERHLPEHIKPGQELSEGDYLEIRRLLARRDQHLKRLYAETSRLMGILENIQMSRLSKRIPAAIKRRLKRWFGFG